MPLTTAQAATLRADILANPALTAWVQERRDDLIAGYYNTLATPTFFIWRNDVRAGEIGDAWVGTDIDGMSALNMQRLQLLLASSPTGVFDMTRADRRAGFENPFGTNQSNASRVAMRAAWRRPLTRGERLFASGTGSEAVPGSTTFLNAAFVDGAWIGTISTNDISAILNAG